MERKDGLVALHRYYIWANRMRTHFDEILSRGDDLSEGKPQIETFLYMSYWYAGLYVVIEGWQKLNLLDALIDDLLKSRNVELLRRYRNGVFHFQPRYDDKRFTDFMENGIDEVTWVRSLNQQFGRYFLAAARKR